MSAAPAPIAIPAPSAPRSTLRMQSSETGPGWAPTKKPSPKPTSSALMCPSLRARAPAGELAVERRQPVVPLVPDLGHPLERLGHRRGRRVVEHLATGTPCRHNAGIGEQGQVLLHGLARGWQLAREVGRARL